MTGSSIWWWRSARPPQCPAYRMPADCVEARSFFFVYVTGFSRESFVVVGGGDSLVGRVEGKVVFFLLFPE